MSKNNKADSLKLLAPAINILSCYREDKRTKSDYIFIELKTVPLKDSKAKFKSDDNCKPCRNR